MAGTATMLIGLFDDLRVMRSIVKLGTNIVVAAREVLDKIEERRGS